MAKLLVFLHSIFLVLLSEFDCSQAGDPVNATTLEGSVLFRTSFEFTGDTLGWDGIGRWSLQGDAPPGGGSQSVLISGGCIVPHAQRMLIAPSYPCSVSVRCWGKNLSLGGMVGVRKGPMWEIMASIDVRDTVWTSYRSTESLYSEPGDTLYLVMWSGGFVPSGMLVDELEVRALRN